MDWWMDRWDLNSNHQTEFHFFCFCHQFLRNIWKMELDFVWLKTKTPNKRVWPIFWLIRCAGAFFLHELIFSPNSLFEKDHLSNRLSMRCHVRLAFLLIVFSYSQEPCFSQPEKFHPSMYQHTPWNFIIQAATDLRGKFACNLRKPTGMSKLPVESMEACPLKTFH